MAAQQQKCYHRAGKTLVRSLLFLLLSLLGYQAFALTERAPPTSGGEHTANAYFEQGTHYYTKGLYRLALERFYLAAYAGNSEAAIQAGLMHDFGKGVPRNFSEAEKWYSRAAAMGASKGIFLLGHMEEYGEGRPVSYARAFRWYREAAELGESNAQFSLAEFYLYGKFVFPDRSKAESWLMRSAAQCNPAAINLLQRIEPQPEVFRKPKC